MTLKIIIDQDKCTGHGVCESLAPDVFEVQEDGIAHLLTEDLPEDMRQALEDAVAECPTQALRLVEAARAAAGPRPADETS